MDKFSIKNTQKELHVFCDLYDIPKYGTKADIVKRLQKKIKK